MQHSTRARMRRGFASMATGLIEIRGGFVDASIEGGGKGARFPLAEALEKLRGWARDYDDALRTEDEDKFGAIGREMFDWLDGQGDWASSWAGQIGDDRQLEIRIAGTGDAREVALLDAPWELLASAKEGPLAIDLVRLFIVSRRVGAKAAPWEPRHGDLQLMFMAAAPEGASDLDYEAEEAGILAATKGLPLRLVVEESGALFFLRERLTSSEGPFEALHLSCHGQIDPKAGPVLGLETPEGDAALAGP